MQALGAGSCGSGAEEQHAEASSNLLWSGGFVGKGNKGISSAGVEKREQATDTVKTMTGNL